MAKDSDVSVSLPGPPPPRPAARRDAIEAALRKFDGIEETPRRPSRIIWGPMNRRPAGALVAATLIAIVAIPAMQIALRDQSAEEVAETREPGLARPGQEAAEAISESPQAPADETTSSRVSPSQPSPPPPIAAEERAGSAMADSERKAEVAESIPVAAPPPPPAMAAAPPPPPPPPPPPAPEPEAAGDGLVVTGSRIRRSDLAKQNDFARRAEESASPLAILDAYDIFLSRLQDGLRSNDRRSVVRLVALPLRVNLGGERKTYRSSRDIERDFDRIFTPAVRQAIFNLGPDTLTSRDGGRLKGNARIWLGCLKTACASDDLIRIREITP